MLGGQRQLAGAFVHPHRHHVVGLHRGLETAQHIGPGGVGGQPSHAWLHRVGRCGRAAGEADAVLIAQPQRAREADAAHLFLVDTGQGHNRLVVGLHARAGGKRAHLVDLGDARAQGVAAGNDTHLQLGPGAAHRRVAQHQGRQCQVVRCRAPGAVAHFQLVAIQVGRLLVVGGVFQGRCGLEGLVHREGRQGQPAVDRIHRDRLAQHAGFAGFDLGLERRQHAGPVVAGAGGHAVLAVVDLHRVHIAIGHRKGHAATGCERLVGSIRRQHQLARTGHHRGGGRAAVDLALEVAQQGCPGAPHHHRGAVAVGTDPHRVDVAHGQFALIEHETGDLRLAGRCHLCGHDPGLAVKVQTADLRHCRGGRRGGGVVGHQLLQRLPFVDAALGIDGHQATRLERPHRGPGLDAVHVQVAGRFDNDVVAIGHVVHVAHVQVVTGDHFDAAVVGLQAVNHQARRLVHTHVAAVAGIQGQRVDQGVELGRTPGVHEHVPGNEDRSAVRGDGIGSQLQTTDTGRGARWVRGDDAALQRQRTFDPQRDVLSRLEAGQAAHKAGQGPVAHRSARLFQVDVDVAQGPNLEVLRRQIVGLHVDEAGERDHGRLVDGVGKTAVAIEVDAGLGLAEAVGGVTVVVEVKGLEHIAAAAGLQDHLFNDRARCGATTVVAGLDRHRARQDQILSGHQFQAAVGRQAAVQRQGAAGLDNDGVRRHVARQRPRVRVGQGAFTELDEVAGAVFNALGCTEVTVQLHRITGHKRDAAVVDQGLAAGRAQHRNAVAGAGQADRIALHQAAVTRPGDASDHGLLATDTQFLLGTDGHVATGGGGDHRPQHIQTGAFLAHAVAVGQTDVAAGGDRVQGVDGGFQPGDALEGTHDELVGHHVDRIVHKGFQHAAAGGCEEHIAQRTERIRGGQAAIGGLDGRQVGLGFGVGAGRDVAHKNVPGRLDADVVGIAVGLRTHTLQIDGARRHVHQIDGARRRQVEVAVGDQDQVELERLAALVDEHIARATGLHPQGIDLGLQRCRDAAQTAKDGQVQFVGQDRLGGVGKCEHAFDPEAHVATAHTEAVAGAEFAHPQVGRRAAAATALGDHRDVVAVAQALGFQAQRVHVAHVVHGDGAVLALRPGHRQGAQVDQRYVTGVAQHQVHRAGLGVQGDAAGRAGHHLAGQQQTAGQGLRGHRAGVCIGVAAFHQGLQHTALAGAERDELACGGRAQGGIGQRYVAAIGTGAQADALAAGHHLGIGVGADAAAARNALPRLQHHRTRGQAARQRQVTPRADRQRGGRVGAAAAAQANVAVRSQRHGRRGRRAGVLRHRQLARIGHIHQVAGPQVQGLGRQAGGDGNDHTVHFGGGHTPQPQGVVGAHGQILGGHHLAAQADLATRIDADAFAADGRVGATEGAHRGFGTVQHRLEHGFGRGDRAAFPQGDVFKRHHRHLLGGGLLHGELFKQIAVQRHQLEVLLDALVFDLFPLRRPGVGVVEVVLIDRLVQLLAAVHLVDVELAATFLARVVVVADRSAQFVVAVVAGVVGRAGVAADVEPTAVDGLFVGVLVAVIDRRSAVLPLVVDDTLNRIEQDVVAGPAPALGVHLPLAGDVFPGRPVLVLETKLAVVGARGPHLRESRGVKSQRVDVGVEGLDAVGVAPGLVQLHGRPDPGVERDGPRVVHIGVAAGAAVVVGVEGNLVGIAHGVVPLGMAFQRGPQGWVPAADLVGFDTRFVVVDRVPRGATVFAGRVRVDAALEPIHREVVARGDLLVIDLAKFLVPSHVFAGGACAQRGPGAAVVDVLVVQGSAANRLRGGHAGVTGQEAGLPHRFDAQDVDVGPLGHAHIAVAPAVGVDVVHDLLGTVPFGRDGLVGLQHTVLGALDHGVVVVELEQRHVAGVLEHGRTLRVVQAGEVQVSGLVGVVEAGRLRA